MSTTPRELVHAAGYALDMAEQASPEGRRRHLSVAGLFLSGALAKVDREIALRVPFPEEAKEA